MERNKIKVVFTSLSYLVTIILVQLVAFHNIDLAYNFKGISNIDCNLFHCVSLDKLYLYATTYLIINIGIIALLVYYLLYKYLKYSIDIQ